MRIILITGANGGLGQSIARAFLLESVENKVYLGVRINRAAVMNLIAEFGERVRIVELEVSERNAWSAAVARIIAESGRLDVLVNNAGTHSDHLLPMMPEESWERVMASNLDGVFHGCKAVLPVMISQRAGRIVNMASLSALLAPAGQTNYAAAKAGVVALTQSLAKEVARMGITVNAVCPGFVSTEAVASMPPEKQQAALAQIPMRRFGEPSEIASVIRFLSSSEASYVTGAVLKVDGGIL